MYLTILFIAVSLSIDAFSLSLSIGSYLSNKHIILFSTLVGLFHFIFPLLGFLVGLTFLKNIPLNPNYLLGIILIILLIDLILNINKNSNIFINNPYELLTLSIAVSIDSLITGISLSLIISNILISQIIFSITSFIFTFLGLYISKKSYKYLGIYSKLLGILILLLLIIKCFYE